MTEQPPIDDIASRPLPETAGADPNALTPPDWKRTAMIVWSLIGLAFAGGLLMIEPSGPGDPRPVGEIDKPGGEGIPVGGEAGVLSGGNGKPD